MKKALLAILGVLLLLLGIAAAVASGLAISVFGTKGEHTTAVAPVNTDTPALYVRSFNVERTEGPQEHLDLRVVVTSANGKQVFVGLTPPDKAQAYLRGVPYDSASKIANGVFEVKPVPGLIVPAPAPEQQTIWTLSDSGTTATLPWDGQQGSEVLVVMNADGSAGVQADISATLYRANLGAMTIGLGVVGALVAVLGVVLLVLAVRSGGKASRASA
ncbi:MAG: hypothetical protein ACH36H_07465 [Candidatus Nanopelagicales bacterium]